MALSTEYLTKALLISKNKRSEEGDFDEAMHFNGEIRILKLLLKISKHHDKQIDRNKFLPLMKKYFDSLQKYRFSQIDDLKRNNILARHMDKFIT